MLAFVNNRRQFGAVQPSDVEAVLIWILVFAEILVHGEVVGEHVSFEDL